MFTYDFGVFLMHMVRMLAAATVVLVGFGVLTPITAASAATPTIKTSVTKPLVGERFMISGSLGKADSRVTKLQAYSASRKVWLTVPGGNTKSTSRGGYSFRNLTITASTRFRVYAPGSKSIKTRMLTVASGGTTQTVGIDTLPGIAQAVDGTQRASIDSSTKGYVRATFTPARPGRAVQLSAPGAGAFTVKQDARGQAIVAARTAQTATWTAKALPSNGVASISKTAAPTAWSEPFKDEFTNGSFAKWQHRYADGWTAGRTCSYVSTKRVLPEGTGAISLTTKKGPANKQPTLTKKYGSAVRPSTSTFKAKCKDKSGYPRVYETSALTSKPFTFSYGVAAARIKFDPKRGQNAAFWLQYVDTSGSEIDIVESGGQTFPEPVRTGIHQVTPSKRINTYRAVKKYSASWYSQFHVVSVEWTPSAYIFRIDGKETYRTTQAPDATRHEIVLSNIVANWSIPYNSGASAKMVVDWVRVWQK